MQHIIDEEYKGHELVFMQAEDKTITVDIRKDNFAGEFLQGYSEMLSVSDARLKATGYIDGLHSRFNPHTQIASVWSVEDVQSLDESLTDEQAMKVLEFAERKHDAEIGINWDVLQMHIDYLQSEGEI